MGIEDRIWQDAWKVVSVHEMKKVEKLFSLLAPQNQRRTRAPRSLSRSTQVRDRRSRTIRHYTI